MNLNEFLEWEERKSQVNDYVDSLSGLSDCSREEIRKEELESLREDVLDNIIE
tara:strand:+ start:442 stop:600 length:159 start_codon:yes stop_codon:yes gene_type:complete